MKRSLKKSIVSVFLAFLLVFAGVPPSLAIAAREDGTASYKNLAGAAHVEKPSCGGALQLLEKDGIKTLCDRQGNPIQLRGVSTSGLQWYPGILNDNAFAALANDWGCNVIRLVLYIGENGYATDPSLKQKVIDGIKLAIQNNLYVIVDWQVSTPGDPNARIYSGAQSFFQKIADLFPNDPHILYELCGDPSAAFPGISNDAEGWQDIKSYAEPIIKALRESGNSNIIAVGSPNHCHRPDLAADDPINDLGVVYTVHFSAGQDTPSAADGDRGSVMSNIRYARKHGAAVMASEWNAADSSGAGTPCLDGADAWLDFLNANNISWCGGLLCTKEQASSVFTGYATGKTRATNLNPGADRVWALSELSVFGEYLRARIKGIDYMPIDRNKSGFNTTVWDFNDDTTQGFAVDENSPVKTVAVSCQNKALKLSGLETSANLNDFWPNVRICADGASCDHMVNIAGADRLLVDVFAACPARVSIAAVPQSAKHGWAIPKRAVTVTEKDFTRQDDGSYKATVVLTKDDCPNLAAIAGDSTDSTLTDLVLFIGANVGTISLDNIAFSGSTHGVEMLSAARTQAVRRYSVNIRQSEGGTVAVSPTKAAAGTTVKVTLTPKKGYALKAGSLVYSCGKTTKAIRDGKFVMPAANVAVAAKFERVHKKK